jgi:hypothetical protein
MTGTVCSLSEYPGYLRCNSGFNNLPWHRSPAATLLAQDVADGMRHIYTPIQLYAMREEYQMFPLDWFCKFIHQEGDKATKKEARFLKKQKKEAKKQQKRRGHRSSSHDPDPL